MKLTPADIQRLYGKRIYIIPQGSPEAPKPQPPSAFNGETEVDWKPKKGANLGLIMHEVEFNDGTLTAKLKDILVSGGVNLGKIGFGVLRGNGPWNTRAIPVPQVLIFSHIKGVEDWQIEEKQFWLLPNLREIDSPEHQDRVEAVLGQIQSK